MTDTPNEPAPVASRGGRWPEGSAAPDALELGWEAARAVPQTNAGRVAATLVHGWTVVPVGGLAMVAAIASARLAAARDLGDGAIALSIAIASAWGARRIWRDARRRAGWAPAP